MEKKKRTGINFSVNFHQKKKFFFFYFNSSINVSKINGNTNFGLIFVDDTFSSVVNFFAVTDHHQHYHLYQPKRL